MGRDSDAAPAPGVAREVELDDPVLLERHEELLQRDHVLGLEAQVESLKIRLRLLRTRNKTLRARLDSARSASRPSFLARVASTARRVRP